MKCSHSITVKQRVTDFFLSSNLRDMFTKEVKKHILKDSIHYGM